MLLKKNSRADLKTKYKRFVEISLILSLSLIILAFKYFPDVESVVLYSEPLPEVIFTVDDILNTRQDVNLPPPPRPAVPIEALTDDVLEDIELPSLDFTNNIVPLPPPPPPARRVEIEEEFIPVAETMPELIGGIQSLQQKIVYPDLAVRVGIEGKVFVMAYVNEKGEVVKTELLKGIGGGCDESALEALSQARFSPGKQRGKPVKVKIAIPIVFKLNKAY